MVKVGVPIALQVREYDIIIYYIDLFFFMNFAAGPVVHDALSKAPENAHFIHVDVGERS